MILRNKRTGEIIEDTDILALLADGNNDIPLYRSLAELNEEWEDYEEPKEEWYINCTGEVLENNKAYCNMVTPEKLQSIGNYFETKEEAEKVVEKLKAWKRLKDAGYYFKPDAIEEGLKHYYILRLECKQEKIMKSVAECKSNYRDLKILFGGEE